MQLIQHRSTIICITIRYRRVLHDSFQVCHRQLIRHLYTISCLFLFWRKSRSHSRAFLNFLTWTVTRGKIFYWIKIVDLIEYFQQCVVKFPSNWLINHFLGIEIPKIRLTAFSITFPLRRYGNKTLYPFQKFVLYSRFESGQFSRLQSANCSNTYLIFYNIWIK